MEVHENGATCPSGQGTISHERVTDGHQNGVTVEAVVESTTTVTDQDEKGQGNGVTSSHEAVAAPRPVLYNSVNGFSLRANDVVYAPPLSRSDPSYINGDSDSSAEEEHDPSGNQINVVVFFGGDIQDTEEMMRANAEYKNYLDWNLENVAQMLQRQFPTSHIVVVRRSRSHIYMYSCYDNFVPSNVTTGHPEHTPNNYAIQHLELLLKNVSTLVAQSARKAEVQAQENSRHEQRVSSSNSPSSGDHDLSSTNGSDNSSSLNPHFDRANVNLVGFSKGSVVLNQLLYEFHYLKTLTPDDHSMDAFIKSIKNMYWLDGGHGGGKNTWITSRSLLETLTRTGIRLHVHMTPYQLNDTRRPYIRREEKIFTECLERLGAQIFRHVHFDKEQATLETHFKVISQFGLITPEFNETVEECHELPSISIFDS